MGMCSINFTPPFEEGINKYDVYVNAVVNTSTGFTSSTYYINSPVSTYSLTNSNNNITINTGNQYLNYQLFFYTLTPFF